MSRFTKKNIDQLLESSDYMTLVELQAIIFGLPKCSHSLPDYGLPIPAFVFVEALTWFAQANRSGVWTYFEATTIERQEAMLSALQLFGAPSFAEKYQFGIANWQDIKEMKTLDCWMAETDNICTVWLRELLTHHSQELQPLFE